MTVVYPIKLFFLHYTIFAVKLGFFLHVNKITLIETKSSKRLILWSASQKCFVSGSQVF